MTMYTVQMPSIAGRAQAGSPCEPCGQRSAPAHAPHAPPPRGPRPPAPRPHPAPEPAPAPAPRPPRNRGDAERIERIERETAKAFRNIDKAMAPVENMSWQLKLGQHAHEKGVLSQKFFPYFQGRLDGVTYGGVQSAAEEGAFQAIKSYEGARGGPNAAVFGAALHAIDALADARCAARGQVDMLQQGLNALAKRKPPSDPCAPAPEPGPRPRPRPPQHADEGRGSYEFEHSEEQGSRRATRVVVRGD